MKLKKLLFPLMLLLLSLASAAQTDTSYANVYFETSKFNLSKEAKDTLDAYIANHKNDLHVWIVGRCDVRGSHAYNDWLGNQRANTVLNYLVAHGFPKETIDTVRGYGKRKQLAIVGSSTHVLDKNRVATVTGSYGVVQKLVETKVKVPDQFAIVKRPAHIDTTYLVDTILLKLAYPAELLVTNKFPHKGDILKVESRFYVRNDSPFIDKKVYVASETMEEPKPPVAVAPPAPAPVPVVKATAPTTPPPPAEIAESDNDEGLGRKVAEKLQGSKIGESLVIRGINFDFGYHKILRKDKPQLDAVLYAMNQIPTLKLEIQGHVCCWPLGQEGFDRDTKEYNLSFNRAKAVFDFLVANGIAADRLTYNGYGMKHPLVFPEKTKDDEYKNRRVEFKILSK